MTHEDGKSKVVFLACGREVEVDAGTSILNAAQAAGVTTIECCGLKPPCGRCRTAVRDGEDNLTPVTKLEEDTKNKYQYLPFERVGCLTRIKGDIVIDMKK